MGELSVRAFRVIVNVEQQPDHIPVSGRRLDVRRGERFQRCYHLIERSGQALRLMQRMNDGRGVASILVAIADGDGIDQQLALELGGRGGKGFDNGIMNPISDKHAGRKGIGLRATIDETYAIRVIWQ